MMEGSGILYNWKYSDILLFLVTLVLFSCRKRHILYCHRKSHVAKGESVDLEKWVLLALQAYGMMYVSVCLSVRLPPLPFLPLPLYPSTSSLSFLALASPPYAPIPQHNQTRRPTKKAKAKVPTPMRRGGLASPSQTLQTPSHGFIQSSSRKCRQVVILCCVVLYCMEA